VLNFKLPLLLVASQWIYRVINDEEVVKDLPFFKRDEESMFANIESCCQI